MLLIIDNFFVLIMAFEIDSEVYVNNLSEIANDVDIPESNNWSENDDQLFHTRRKRVLPIQPIDSKVTEDELSWSKNDNHRRTIFGTKCHFRAAK